MANERYDVFLGTPPITERFGFFDRIAEGIESLGRKVYATHQHNTSSPNQWSNSYAELLRSDVGVFYTGNPTSEMGEPTASVAMMVSEASRRMMPRIYFFEAGSDPRFLERRCFDSLCIKGVIEFDHEGIAIQQVKQAVEYVFDTSSERIQKNREELKRLGEIAPVTLAQLLASGRRFVINGD